MESFERYNPVPGSHCRGRGDAPAPTCKRHVLCQLSLSRTSYSDELRTIRQRNRGIRKDRGSRLDLNLAVALPFAVDAATIPLVIETKLTGQAMALAKAWSEVLVIKLHSPLFP